MKYEVFTNILRISKLMSKRIFNIIATILLTVNLFAQIPEKISYQAVIRNADNELVTNQNISVQISILQNSAEGASVYTETHNPTTNSNGLVTLEIGSGTTTGDFSAIDWAGGTYFIKTETGPTGSTNYTITGTSQVLSVPYALHAKTADNIIGTVSESDPLFTASVASGISSADTAKWNSFSDITEVDPEFKSSVASGITGSDTSKWHSKQNKLIAGYGISIKNDTIYSKTYEIGDFAQGGIIFWLDGTKQHGLVCSKVNQGSSNMRWYAGTHTSTMALGNGLFAGKMNTAIIIANQGIGDSTTYAARICNELQVTEDGNVYGDWYLPSTYELNLMYQNSYLISLVALENGGEPFVWTSFYLSSTEINSTFVWGQLFFNGNQAPLGKHNPVSLRAIRAF